ncbi:capsule biosynthesis GfcC family protein [Vibrio mangrovi]|uniref:Capsule biosynthesis GfcC family protein n=1 Tax=Vibrio mangrovi TaxID=474394 RepID=A0A1Y6IV39_9VIBR|nr:capsule biosynthesis GfcC family protein [Vibrio mangrovi]MDW6002179.1 capsule biosynthesis GfcC family protein [Vibrio mangrovi]SMS01524.1 hypothetical protein VIM7927_02820 [Vibrio mangrovi]
MTLWKIISYFITIVSITFTPASYASSPVDVEIHFASSSQIHIEFDYLPRLDEAVLQGLDKTGTDWKTTDWMMSGLYDINVPYSLKQQVLSFVTKQQDIASQRYHDSWYYWSQLNDSLNALHYAKRIFQTIDPDATRLSHRLNPQLSGHWLISLKKSPKDVLVLGGVTTPGKRPWRSRLDARSYAQAAGLVDITIPEIFVIQPDGKVEKHRVGYWNQTFSEIAPGAIIYVPLPVEELPVIYPDDHLQNPNDLVVELLRNRLP